MGENVHSLKEHRKRQEKNWQIKQKKDEGKKGSSGESLLGENLVNDEGKT